MSRHMRTTVRLDDGLLDQAKREAARRGETLTSLIEQGLRIVLQSKNSKPNYPGSIPVSTATGGPRPGLDFDDVSSVMDYIEGLDDSARR